MAEYSESELAFLSIGQAAALLRKGKISPVELTEAALTRIERLNPGLNAFITVTAERARQQARTAEREIRRGGWRGPLHGIPITLKDNFWTRGIRTTAGSKILANFVPQRDSIAGRRLARAGAILLGKTNMHEFAYGITSENPHFGPARNPWSPARITGGSSGGSAAAVAAGLCFGSAGTDTGGSIRIPAALCGIVGLKPTFGLVSVAGVVPLSGSLDHVGPLARGAEDACILLEAMAGKYPAGATPPDHRKLCRNRPRKFRLGWPKQHFFERVDEEVLRLIEAAAKTLQSLGGRIEQVPLPRAADSVQAGTDIALVEATRYHQAQDYFPMLAGEYGEDVRSRIEAGCNVRAVDYLGAFEIKRQIEADFDAAFGHVDAILVPASRIPAPPIGATEVKIAGANEPVRAALLGTSRPANVSGHPAISIPCGFTREGLPAGLQLIGPRWSEARLLSIALAYEAATEWHKARPGLK